ncbi:hypothetical protein L9F63_004564, partial [Diploptera punctata]
NLSISFCPSKRPFYIFIRLFAAAVFPFHTSKAYDLGHLQCLVLLLALLSSCLPSMLTLVSLFSSF